jgi:hypothetical protein
MEQIEVNSWETLDALKSSATKIVETIGDLSVDEQMSVFCYIEDDCFELYYSALESNYIRHFESEEEFYQSIKIRKNELGEGDFNSTDYYNEDDEFNDDNSNEDYDGYSISNEDEGDEF